MTNTTNNPFTSILKLPSCGISYSEVLHVRPITYSDELFIFNPANIRNKNIIEELISRCVLEVNQGNIKYRDLYIEDEKAIILFLRVISYGKDYNVSIKCPECNRNFDTNIDCSNITVEYNTEKLQGTTIQLPVSKYKVALRFPKVSDRESVSDENVYFAIIPKIITSVTSENGDPVDIDMIEVFLASLVAADSATIRDAVYDSPFYVDDVITIDCPKCGANIETLLPYSAEFFRISTRRKHRRYR